MGAVAAFVREVRLRADLLAVMWNSNHCILVLSIILFVGAVLTAQAPAPQNPEQLVEDALQKQQRGDLQGAVPEYREFLKLHPEATPIHSNLGAALAGLGRFEEAISEYKTALKQSPKFPGARLNLALAYYKMGRIADGASQLEKVHAEEPANHQAILLLGDCYLRMEQNKSVIRLLAPEEKKSPDDLAIAYMLGTAYIRDGQVGPGQALVDRILRNGDSAEAHLMMGSAKMGIQDFAGARDEFSKAVALNPNLPTVHGLYAAALHLTGDSEQSSKEFQAELAVDPYNFDANLQLGANAREEHKYDEASQYFHRALETRPGDPGVSYQLALIDSDQGRLDNARQKLEALVKHWPQFTEAHVSLSLVYFRLKRPEDGKRERDIVQKLTAEAQAKQPGVKQQ
ncbi:MAG TPA: tetratricopeptide repeat protein [Terriglobales bacterium]|nr:tetratricopeptide repeat protein [Terriglobales bacterium]